MDQESLNLVVAEANRFYENGQLGAALELYREILVYASDHAWAHSRIGAILAQTGDETGAEEAFKIAIELDPSLPQAHSNLGNIYYNRGDFEAALLKYKEAIVLSPDTPVFHENLHAAYKKLGRLSEAVASLKKAHRIEREGSKTEARQKFRETTKGVRKRLGCLGAVLVIGVFGVIVWLV